MDEIDENDEYGHFIDIEEEYYNDFNHIIEIGEDIVIEEKQNNNKFVSLFYFMATSFLFVKLWVMDEITQ